MWRGIAPALATRFTTVPVELRGCGRSSAPRGADGERDTERAMAEEVVRVMEDLGHARFAVAGHGRGARVGARLALDHPGRLTRVALLDVLPALDARRRTFAPHATGSVIRSGRVPAEENAPDPLRAPGSFFDG